MASRIEEFDILKGIGILLVMLGHAPISSCLHNVIYSFHLPLFFIASGYFFKPEPILKYASKTAYRLLVPWIFFVFLFSTLSFALYFIGSRNFMSALHQYWHSLNPLDESCWELYRTIWFLVSLFFALNLFNILSKLIKSKLLFGGVIIATYLLGFYIGHTFNIPFFIDTALSVLIFIYVGNIAKDYHLEQKLSNPGCIIYFIIGIIFAILLQPAISLRENIYPIYMLILATAIVAGLFSICVQISKYNNIIKCFLAYCGVESLCILGFHRFFYEILIVLFNRVGINGNIRVVALLLFSLPLIFAMTWIISRFCPRLVGKR